jgi:hypothetical protein
VKVDAIEGVGRRQVELDVCMVGWVDVRRGKDCPSGSLGSGGEGASIPPSSFTKHRDLFVLCFDLASLGRRYASSLYNHRYEAHGADCAHYGLIPRPRSRNSASLPSRRSESGHKLCAGGKRSSSSFTLGGARKRVNSPSRRWE